MRPHDASAYAQASPEHRAAAHATDGRTDALTEKSLRWDESSPSVSRAGGHTESLHHRSEHAPRTEIGEGFFGDRAEVTRFGARAPISNGLRDTGLSVTAPTLLRLGLYEQNKPSNEWPTSLSCRWTRLWQERTAPMRSEQEQLVLLTEKCTERDCSRLRYGELTDDANTHWHTKRGIALVPVSSLAALAEAEARAEAANQRADELAEQYALAAPYYPMYYDERRGRESAEAELRQLRDQIAAARTEAFQTAINEVHKEARWQLERWMCHESVITTREAADRFCMVEDILRGFLIRHDSSPSTITHRCPWCDEPVETPGSVLNSEHVSGTCAVTPPEPDDSERPVLPVQTDRLSCGCPDERIVMVQHARGCKICSDCGEIHGGDCAPVAVEQPPEDEQRRADSLDGYTDNAPPDEEREAMEWGPF